MTALVTRQKAIRGTLRRLRAQLPGADGDSLRHLAELDSVCSVLFAEIVNGKTSKDTLFAYSKLVDQRTALMQAHRLTPQVPRPKVKDDPELDPYVQRHLEALRARGEKV